MKFKLASVLKLRENQEKQAKRELGIVNTKVTRINEEKELIGNRQQEISNLSRASMGKTLDINEFKYNNNYLSYLQKELQKKDEELKKAQQELEQKKEQLKEAVKERKILENLKQVHYEEYLAKVKQKENDLLDELVSYKYSSKESRV